MCTLDVITNTLHHSKSHFLFTTSKILCLPLILDSRNQTMDTGGLASSSLSTINDRDSSFTSDQTILVQPNEPLPVYLVPHFMPPTKLVYDQTDLDASNADKLSAVSENESSVRSQNNMVC